MLEKSGWIGLPADVDDGAREHALFEAWRSGDAGAGDRLLQRHTLALHAFFGRTLGDGQQASDLVQDTLVAVLESRHACADAAALRRHIFVVARHCSSARLAGEGRRRRVEASAASAGDDAPSLPALLILRSDAQRLHTAMASLSSRLREVLELFYFDSLHTVTIAARLGLPHATVRTRLHRARLSLRRSVEGPRPR